MVGNVILMMVLAVALTFGGFLYMDYLTERRRNQILDRKIEQVKYRVARDCGKE